MDFPYPYNRNYTMNWFLLSLLNDHLNQLLARYSRLQPIRIDLFYRKGLWRYLHHGMKQTESEVRLLAEMMMRQGRLVGYFWVLESTPLHGCHAHIVMYLNRHNNQATYPVAEQAGALWQDITESQGYHNRCDHKASYEADITQPVNYDDSFAINGLRYIISYLAKEEQKDGHYYYGSSEVPTPSGLGRPRGNQ
ncbi:inovirus-type Gp2 protein [Pectobacterium carotovorum subsp. carotovorum]|uniref:YagK/YfjJ domain-containing protein n=1 Tax=Pectobacterium carotovorum TaxID=554 RepID=UPI002365B80D|nr:inovirus-type Gp2 protein [Pectobacterium carotovorum]WDF97742.1 inovirus-type Gp2 protein [Pectobacterium carotovorum subsp. carotovorum]